MPVTSQWEWEEIMTSSVYETTEHTASKSLPLHRVSDEDLGKVLVNAEGQTVGWIIAVKPDRINVRKRRGFLAALISRGSYLHSEVDCVVGGRVQLKDDDPPFAWRDHDPDELRNLDIPTRYFVL